MTDFMILSIHKNEQYPQTRTKFEDSPPLHF